MPASKPSLILAKWIGRALVLSLCFVAIAVAGWNVSKLRHANSNVALLKEKVERPHRQIAVTVRKRDSLSKIFKRLSLHTGDIPKLLAYKDARQVYNIRPGQKLHFTLNSKTHDWVSFRYSFNIYDTLVVKKSIVEGKRKFAVDVTHLKPQSHLEYIASELHGKTLYGAMKKTSLSSKLIGQLAYVFQNDVNIWERARDGDKIALLYKIEHVGDKRMPDRVMVAELVHKNKLYKAIRYTDSHKHSDYYGPKGLALKRSFLRSPVKGARISSRFNLHRMHPVLHIYRPHHGVDFAARRGSPVKATANGKIIFMGRRGGYGNAVVIKHDGKYSTLYGHLKGFSKKFHRGSYIHQGQIFGFLGSTGLSTGPNLHYEVRVNGRRRDPMKIKLPRITRVASSERDKFFSLVHELFAQLDSHHYINLAANI